MQKRETNKFGEHIIFKDAEKDYQLWLQANPHGFVLNVNYYQFSMIHKAFCKDIRTYAKNRHSFTQNKSFKVCSLNKQALKQWSKENEKKLRVCQHCKNKKAPSGQINDS